MEKYIRIPRRQFLKVAGCAGLGLVIPQFQPFDPVDPIPDRYKGLKSRRYLGKVKVETRIRDKAIFTEGPAVDRSGAVYFTNIPVNKILKWDPEAKTLSIFRADSNGANGLRFAMNGDLLVCEGGSGKITRIEMKSGTRSILTEQFRGKGIQSPNDLDVDAKGRIYFSSRTGKPNLQTENTRSVYRLDPDGNLHQLLTEPEVRMPNGVVVSPDEKTLYLIEAYAEKEPQHRKILGYNLHADGSLSHPRIVCDFYPGRSGDGMCVDEAGNLYVAAGLHKLRGSSETLDTRPGIHVISPAGKLLAFRETPEDTITNCSFGGKDLRTLFITCGSYLLSIRTRIPGKKAYRPRL